jgi:membrane protein YdbS with pleckstrin-like domain
MLVTLKVRDWEKDQRFLEVVTRGVTQAWTLGGLLVGSMETGFTYVFKRIPSCEMSMSSAPNFDRLICPSCSAKFVSTKTVNLSDKTMVSCATCKSKFSLAQGRIKGDRVDDREEPESESESIEPSSYIEDSPPPLDLPPFVADSFETGPSVSHFEGETAFSMRTERLAKEVVEAVRPRLGEIPSDIAEVLDEKDIIYANNPSGTAKVLMRVSLLIIACPFLVFILVQLFFLVTGSFSIGLLMIIFLELIGLAIPFLLLHLSWKNTFYVITRDKIVVRSGIFNRAIKIAWIRNIQEISINSGVLDRWLNLNTIHFATASSGLGGVLLGWIPGSSLGGIHFRHVELKKVLRALKTLEL